MTIPASSTVADYCLAGLLRAHRSQQAHGSQFQEPRVAAREREELLLRWALSDSVKFLAMHLVERPRDVRSAIAFETQTYSGEIPGVVDARASLAEQESTGDATLFVVAEPSVSPLTRRNHVLAWVLREAESLILSAARLHELGPDQAWIHERAALLERATRTRLLREVMLSPAGRRRPGSAAIRDAQKSLSQIYRMAARAMIEFEAVERIDRDAIKALLSSTLLAKLEDWQQLELAAGLAAAEALSLASGTPMRWKGSIAGGSEIITVGRYSIHWQCTLPKRPHTLLDPSEELIARAVEAFKASLGRARADITVRDVHSEIDVAHLECKWFGAPASEATAIVDAVSQLVRYCRDSRPDGIAQAEALLRDCVVVCSVLSSYEPGVDGSRPVGLVSFATLAGGSLDLWGQRIHQRVSFSPAA